MQIFRLNIAMPIFGVVLCHFFKGNDLWIAKRDFQIDDSGILEVEVNKLNLVDASDQKGAEVLPIVLFPGGGGCFIETRNYVSQANFV